MRRVVKHIPNTLTLLNLACGCLAITMASYYNFDYASLFIFIAAVFDLLDGMAARALNAQSEIGKELDSLADMTSFGAAPGLLLFFLVNQKLYLLENWNITMGDGIDPGIYLPLASCFLVPVFSALRLAKFNVSDSQSDGFTGLPTPANALIISTLPFLLDYEINGEKLELTLITGLSVILTNIVLSALLVAPAPMLAFKFKNFSLHKYFYHLVFLAAAAPLFAVFQYLERPFLSVPLIFIVYVLCSLADALRRKRKSETAPEPEKK